MKNVKNNVIEVLKQCNDPELPIDLWNLGLIYDLKINEEGEKLLGRHCYVSHYSWMHNGSIYD